MGLHLHRKITASLIALMMLMSFQAPVVFGADENNEAVQETTAEIVTQQEAETEFEADEQKQEVEPEPEKEIKSEPESEPEKKTEPEKEETKDRSAEKQEQEESNEPSDDTSAKEPQESIEIAFSLFGDMEHDADQIHLMKNHDLTEWVQQTTLSVPEKSTVRDVLETVIQQVNGKCAFNNAGDLESITVTVDHETVKLASGDNGEYSAWMYMVNGDHPEACISDYVLKSGDKLTIHYTDSVLQEKGQLEVSENNTEESETAEESEARKGPALSGESDFKVKAMTVSDQSVSNAYGNTKDKVTDIGDRAKWSADAVWLVIGLARAGELNSNQAAAYFNSILSELNAAGSPKLNANQSSNNSRAILALTAAGYDPTNVGGYNLLEPLSNMSYVRAQGINGPIWALLAFDSKGYEIPQISGVSEAVAANLQTSREKLIMMILDSRKKDGGWAFSGSTSDVDMTAMAIQALAPYYNSEPDVKTAVDEALSWLSSVQNSDGSFSSYGSVTSESASQVIVALTSLGIDPTKDERFLKNNKGAIDSLISFFVKGGGFKHISTNYKSDPLASMQGYYALVAYYRYISNKNSLYNMSDAGDGFVIEVNYSSEKINEPTDEQANDDDKPGDDPVDTREKKKNEVTQKTKALGATKGLTKSAGLIKLKGAKENAKKSIGIIEAVVKRGLSEDAATYSEEDIKAINEAYRMYLDLQPAEKLVVEKDKNWKAFCKLTDALGALYHIDRDRGVDVLDNNGVIMPWYVKLVVRQQDIPKTQSDKIVGLLGENGQIFTTLDINFVNTLVENDGDGDKEPSEESQWHPSNILIVNLGIPDALRNNPVIVHITGEGKIELLRNEVVKDEENRYEAFDSYAQFQSDDFSVYGVAGTSESIRKMINQTKEEEEKPQTDCLIWVYGIAAALAVLALILILIRRSGLSKETDT